jgi:predicted dehydrogenase
MKKREITTYKILVVGLGSMGKRRIRNMQHLGFNQIYGFDIREDRCIETTEKYEINIVGNVENAILENKIELLIISVPPDIHHHYIELALSYNLHFFVEASVVDTGIAESIDRLKGRHIVAAPSSTLYFHPAIKKIYEIVGAGILGKITNVIYHSGQYLPDWHTYEKVSDFYVSKQETGGAREIVPFELTWIAKLFGFPKSVYGIYKKTINIEGAPNIEDTYNALLEYNDFIINLTVDVVSRNATRVLLINGDQKQLTWNWNDNEIRIFDPLTNHYTSIAYEANEAETNYNKNITEQMYFDELNNFFDAIEGKDNFFNTMEFDHKILKLLYAIENSYKTEQPIKINPS